MGGATAHCTIVVTMWWRPASYHDAGGSREVLVILAQYMCDFNAADAAGQTALQILVAQQMMEDARLVVEAGPRHAFQGARPAFMPGELSTALGAARPARDAAHAQARASTALTRRGERGCTLPRRPATLAR